MQIVELTDHQCRELLARSAFARLACARDNQPYIVPIHLYLEGEYLYGYSTEGQKIDWMRGNPRVCLEVDEVATTRAWATVVVYGHYEELPNEDEYADARRVAERLFQRRAMWWEPAAVPVAGGRHRTTVVFRIRIDRISGRRAASDEPPDAGDAGRRTRPRGLLGRLFARIPRDRA